MPSMSLNWDSTPRRTTPQLRICVWAHAQSAEGRGGADRDSRPATTQRAARAHLRSSRRLSGRRKRAAHAAHGALHHSLALGSRGCTHAACAGPLLHGPATVPFKITVLQARQYCGLNFWSCTGKLMWTCAHTAVLWPCTVW